MIQYISIHALREEGDSSRWSSLPCPQDFYPRPPRGGRLSRDTAWCRGKTYFYPRPPRGGRPLDSWHYGDNYTISIHALREEGDKLRSATLSSLSVFLSTPSARRATRCPSVCCRPMQYFYPRPPRGGRPSSAVKLSTSVYFYPRPPRGGRLCRRIYHISVERFLSTPSARRATFHCRPFQHD